MILLERTDKHPWLEKQSSGGCSWVCRQGSTYPRGITGHHAHQTTDRAPCSHATDTRCLYPACPHSRGRHVIQGPAVTRCCIIRSSGHMTVDEAAGRHPWLLALPATARFIRTPLVLEQTLGGPQIHGNGGTRTTQHGVAKAKSKRKRFPHFVLRGTDSEETKHGQTQCITTTCFFEPRNFEFDSILSAPWDTSPYFQ